MDKIYRASYYCRQYFQAITRLVALHWQATASTIGCLSALWIIGFCNLFLIAAIIGSGIVFTVTCLINLIIGILAYVVYPLGIFLIGLLAVMSLLVGGLVIAASITVVGLIGCGLYSCPRQDSFKPWFENFMKNMMIGNTPNTRCGQSSTITATNTSSSEDESEESKYSWEQWKSYCSGKVENIGSRLVDYYGPTIMIKALTTKMTVRYFHLGFCQLALCSDLGTDSKEVIFIGTFNTWFPFPYC